MKDLITIGLPSKGRLKEKSISFFNDRGFKIIQSKKERNYFGTIENKTNVKIIFLHAKEIIQRLELPLFHRGSRNSGMLPFWG